MSSDPSDPARPGPREEGPAAAGKPSGVPHTGNGPGAVFGERPLTLGNSVERTQPGDDAAGGTRERPAGPAVDITSPGGTDAGGSSAGPTNSPPLSSPAQEDLEAEVEDTAGGGGSTGSGVAPDEPAARGAPDSPERGGGRLRDGADDDRAPGGRPAGDGTGALRGPVDAPAPPVDREEPPLKTVLEAVLLVVDEPVPEPTLAQAVERSSEDVRAALTVLSAEYEAEGRGFQLRRVAGGWRLYTRESCAPYVERFVLEGQQARLTQAALETLAVVAYRQPVTRGRVAAVRGVNVDGVMRTLVGRGLVAEAGQDPDSGAILYRTTDYFLERLGLESLDGLPPLAPHLPEVESLLAEQDGSSSAE